MSNLKSVAEFLNEIGTQGYSVFERVIPEADLPALRADIERACRDCQAMQQANGLGEGMAGAAHHAVGGGGALDAFLYQHYLDEHIAAYFGGAAYILNSYGALINFPSGASHYAHGHNFHRDVRTYSGDFKLMINMLVMVDEFTEQNGATKLIPGSHLVEARPDEAYFEQHAVRALGPAGSIVLFDSNLWHSAAPNVSDKARVALTPTFTRAFVKQQLDYPRMLGEDFPKTEKLRQLLGYRARVPANLNEWYQPAERRMYYKDQG
ncbi:phytanoyl-CoA dioxygenase family protein [Chitinimonas naiadis]